MDLRVFDNQTGAESAHKIALFDPSKPEGKGEQLFSGKAECRVLAKLPTAQSVQKAQRALTKKRQADGGKNAIRDMMAIHEGMIEDCLLLITGFENIERDGRPLTDSEDDKRWFLGLVFPIMGAAKDEDGKVVQDVAFDRDGKPVSTPKMEMKNDPFTFQITRKTSELAQNLGNGKAA